MPVHIPYSFRYLDSILFKQCLVGNNRLRYTADRKPLNLIFEFYNIAMHRSNTWKPRHKKQNPLDMALDPVHLSRKSTYGYDIRQFTMFLKIAI